ncbi:MAG TPA: protein YgfX [Thiobacillus sp.]
MHEIVTKPSRLLGLLLLGMVGLATVAIVLASIPVVLQLAMGLAVIGLGGVNWRRVRQTQSIRITAEGMIQCQDVLGDWHEVEVQGESLVSPALIVLRYRLDTLGVQTLVLLPDSADAEALRRLRVSLRWARHTRSDTRSPDAG